MKARCLEGMISKQRADRLGFVSKALSKYRTRTAVETRRIVFTNKVV